MQEKRHDRVVEMRLCFFLGKVGDYNVSFVETRMCRSTPKGGDPHGNGVTIVVRARESLVHGEG